MKLIANMYTILDQKLPRNWFGPSKSEGEWVQWSPVIFMEDTDLAANISKLLRMTQRTFAFEVKVVPTHLKRCNFDFEGHGHRFWLVSTISRRFLMQHCITQKPLTSHLSGNIHFSPAIRGFQMWSLTIYIIEAFLNY